MTIAQSYLESCPRNESAPRREAEVKRHDDAVSPCWHSRDTIVQKRYDCCVTIQLLCKTCTSKSRFTMIAWSANIFFGVRVFASGRSFAVVVLRCLVIFVFVFLICIIVMCNSSVWLDMFDSGILDEEVDLFREDNYVQNTSYLKRLLIARHDFNPRCFDDNLRISSCFDFQLFMFFHMCFISAFLSDDFDKINLRIASIHDARSSWSGYFLDHYFSSCSLDFFLPSTQN